MLVRFRISPYPFALHGCTRSAKATTSFRRLVVIGTTLFLIAHQPAHSQNARLIPDLSASEISADPVTVTPALAKAQSEPAAADLENQPESEVTFIGAGSFGHYHLLANSWWSDLYWSGIEYDRHSWGTFLKAQMDYVAEFQPIVILRQPSKTDVWGNSLTTAREVVPGVGIAPIGLRMMWRSGKSYKPYLLLKGGMVGYTQKALSQYASYANLSLQVGIGVQFHLHDRFDLRLGLTDYHFSDAFVVPSNPGLDVMAYTGGLSYHLGKHAH
jgi:Lipid A 3-O-deacylase (PagL)